MARDRDYSYTDTPVEFIEVNSGIIFLKDKDGDVFKLTLSRWQDGWDFYPVTEHEKFEDFVEKDGHYVRR